MPDRESQIDCICGLIPRPSGPAQILDLCCGEGLLTRALLDRFPESEVHGLDGSPKMIARIKTKLAVYGKRFEAMRFDLSSRDWRSFPWPIHAVVSSLAIHHYDYFREIQWNLYSDPKPNPIDKPSPLFDQLKWLAQAGFTDIDVFWMKAGHAIFGGRKPIA